MYQHSDDYSIRTLTTSAEKLSYIILWTPQFVMHAIIHVVTMAMTVLRLVEYLWAHFKYDVTMEIIIYTCSIVNRG